MDICIKGEGSEKRPLVTHHVFPTIGDNPMKNVISINVVVDASFAFAKLMIKTATGEITPDGECEVLTTEYLIDSLYVKTTESLEVVYPIEEPIEEPVEEPTAIPSSPESLLSTLVRRRDNG